MLAQKRKEKKESQKISRKPEAIVPHILDKLPSFWEKID